MRNNSNKIYGDASLVPGTSLLVLHSKIFKSPWGTTCSLVFFSSFTVSVLVIFITCVPRGLTTGKDPLQTLTALLYFPRLTGELIGEGAFPNPMFLCPYVSPVTVCHFSSHPSHTFTYGNATCNFGSCFSTPPRACIHRSSTYFRSRRSPLFDCAIVPRFGRFLTMPEPRLILQRVRSLNSACP